MTEVRGGSVVRRVGLRIPAPALYAAIGFSAASIALLLVGNHSLPIGVALSAVIIPVGTWWMVLREERCGQRVDVRVIVIAIGALMLLAVALAPAESRDLWAYQMYGRTLWFHGVSPYTHPPHDFPHDPFLHLMSHGWRRTPAVYGPVFLAFAALGSGIAGSSVVVARLFHQVGAALAVSVALRLIWQRTHSPAAVMLLGMNALVIVTVINGGHNDALVGLGVLGSVVLAEKRSVTAAGLVLGLAALIKVTALLALPALAIWTLYRFGSRAASYLAGTTIGSVILGNAIVGTAAITALGSNRRLISRASPWQAPASLFGIYGHHPFAGLSRSDWLAVFGVGSLALVSALALATAWRRRRDREPGAVVAWALTAYLVAGIYVLPWYCVWMLPTMCLVRRRATLAYVALLGACMTGVYLVKYRAFPTEVGTGWRWSGAFVLPLAFLVAYVVLALVRSDQTDDETAYLRGAAAGHR
ncbi:MAG: glycosyltransferase 87 family protein [Acidimicrobiia bacterium]